MRARSSAYDSCKGRQSASLHLRTHCARGILGRPGRSASALTRPLTRALPEPSLALHPCGNRHSQGIDSPMTGTWAAGSKGRNADAGSPSPAVPGPGGTLATAHPPETVGRGGSPRRDSVEVLATTLSARGRFLIAAGSSLAVSAQPESLPAGPSRAVCTGERSTPELWVVRQSKGASREARNVLGSPQCGFAQRCGERVPSAVFLHKPTADRARYSLTLSIRYLEVSGLFRATYRLRVCGG